MHSLLILLILFGFTLDAGAQDSPENTWEFKSKGELGGESRWFFPDDNALSEDFGVGLAGRVEAKALYEPWTLQGRVFGRTDFFDHERSRVYPEELWFDFEKGRFSIRAGAQLLNWTATEAFHPADILNSRNLDSKIENAEKIGEPMISIATRIGHGVLTVFYLPAIISPILPSAKSRQNFAPPGIEVGEALLFEQSGKQSDDHFAPQWGASLSQSIGSADLSLQFIQHVDRTQPVIVLDPQRAQLRPAYLFVNHAGGTYVQAIGSWVLKGEAAWRMFEDPGFTPYGLIDQKNHAQLAAGIEYLLPNASGMETTFLLEGQSVIRPNQAERQALQIFQNDVLIGARHAFNDVMGRELLAYMIVDVERKEELLFSLSYQQRLSDTWKVETGVRVIHAPLKAMQPVGLERLNKADQVYLNLIRYF